jgi:hypothetical protein
MSSMTLAVVGNVPQPIVPGTTYDVRMILAGDDGPQPATETFTGMLTTPDGQQITTLQIARLVPDDNGPDHSNESLASTLASSTIEQDATDPLLFHVTAH